MNAVQVYLILTITLLMGVGSLYSRTGVWLPTAAIVPVVLAVLLIGPLNDKERYTYPNAYVTGYLAGGTVYAKYPEKTPGLGWIM